MTDFKQYGDIVYKIIGASMKVHSVLGWGLLEPLYNEALFLELKDRGVDSNPEQLLPCFYKEHQMEKYYRMDLVVEDVVVELKAVSEILPVHRAQLFNYLRLTKKPVGLLINFGGEHLQGERYGYDVETNECILLDKDMEPVYEEIDEDYDYDPDNG